MQQSKSKAPKRKIAEVEQPVENGDLEEDPDMSDEEGGTRIDDIYIPPPPKPTVSIDTTGSRLVITRISSCFFKSFGKEQILGPFHKCFNAIVGPNGSGKSNVIDAMLFVFGYRASKLRSKKMSVLLHNSEHYSNVQSCTVAVHFAVIVDKEGEDYEFVPNSEFNIARTAFKDNSSSYTINGRRVQFKEVAKMLRNYGVDLDHNRFLILQGEVEEIAMMKCKGQSEHETGMLEYLEDIVGTSRYKVPIAKLEDRFELLADKRSEMLNRVKLVQKEVSELQKPMEEAVEFLKFENDVVTHKNFIYQYQILDLENKVTKVEQDKLEFANSQKDIAEKLAELAQEKSGKQAELKSKSTNYESLEKRNEMLKEAYNKATNKDEHLLAEMTQLNETRKKTKKSLEEERKKLVELEALPQKNTKTIEECEGKIQEMSVKKESLDKEKLKLLASLRTLTQELQQQKEVLQTDLIQLNEVVNETKAAFNLAETDLQEYVSNEERERTKLESLQNSYETAKQTITTASGEIAQLKKKIPLTEKSLKEARGDLGEVAAKESQLIDQIRMKRTALGEIKLTMEASRSRGKVLDSLTQQKREGNCPGLFGRLGDLGAIDSKYDVAVSTACGPLDNIVVDTISTAQWCIEFLKQHDIGRATFIALEKQEHLRNAANRQINTPENVPRLYDLIRVPDDRIKPAFYYALRDTLVASDLNQATRIAYGAQRYRVVTLAGQLIETSGTMSGGGKSVSRGRMGQSVTVSNVDPKEVESKERELEKLEDQIRQLRQRQATFESQINTLEPELNQMKINLQKLTADYQSAKQEEPLLAKQLKAQEATSKSTKADASVVKKLTQVLNGKKAAYDEAAAISGSKQAEVDKITKEIKDKTAGKMKTVDKSLNEAVSTMDKCKNEITRLQVGIKTSHRNVKKAQDKLAQMEQSITDAENKLRAMKAEREEIEEDCKKLCDTIEKIVTQLAESTDDFAELKAEVAKLGQQENKLKAEKIEIDEKCKTFDRSINEKKAEIHGFRSKLTQLKLQQLPDQSDKTLQVYAADELTTTDLQNAQRELHYIQEQLKSMKPNLAAITDYRNKQSVFIKKSGELDALSQQKTNVKECLDGVKLRRKEEFFTGYNTIRLKLKEMYQMITLGGDADFEMVDTFDPFTEGIQFNVRPPKKSWKNISNLSGGEKTLSSLALVFALHYYKPSPLYVMDEIDAALDFKNVSIVGNYIKERTKNAQFIIISLRSNMFELCDHLIGIYKTFNCTKTVCIDPRHYESEGKRAAPTQTEQPEVLVNGEVIKAVIEAEPIESESEVTEASISQTSAVVENNAEMSSASQSVDEEENQSQLSVDEEENQSQLSSEESNSQEGSVVIESSFTENLPEGEAMDVD